MAYDLEREDWRTFRVDRVSEPFATGARFAPRPLPMDAQAFVRKGLRGGDTYPVDVTFAAGAAELPQWLREEGHELTEAGGGVRVRFESGEPPTWLAVRLALTGPAFTVHSPEALSQAAAALGARLSAAPGTP